MSLVVGAAGAVGKRLIGALAWRGDTVVAALRRTPLPDHLQTIVAAQEMNVDVRDVASLRKIFEKHPGIHTVWNLAAPLSVETANDPSVARDVTMGGMKNILEVMKGTDARKLIFTDSIGSYGASAPRSGCTARWLTENPEQDPGSDYGLQKRGCRDLMAKFAKEHGGDTRWAVLPGVLHMEASWGQGTTEYALDALQAAAEGQPFECPVDPDVQMPMVWADDLIRGLLALDGAPAAALKEPERGYCLPGFSFSANELFREIRRINECRDFTTSVALDANMNKFANLWPDDLSGAEAKRDFGYSPAVGLEEVVKKILHAHHARKAPSASAPELASIEFRL